MTPRAASRASEPLNTSRADILASGIVQNQ